MDPQIETETETDFDQISLFPTTDPSPSPKLKRLKKTNPNPSKPTHQSLLEPDESDDLNPVFSEGGAKRALLFAEVEKDSGDDLVIEPDESDGLDPLFSEIGATRCDADDLFNKETECLDLSEMIDSASWKNKKKRKSGGGGKRVVKPKESKQKEKEERKAQLAQQADFQRVMREKKSVGFKPLPMVEKSISSVLEKIRQRKMEMSKKMTGFRSEQKPAKVILLDEDEEDGDGDFMLDVQIDAGATKFEAPSNETSEDKSCSNHEERPNKNNLVEETEKSFRPPVDDTQDLFSDSQASDSQENPSNEEPESPVEDVSPSLPSLNLRLDSVPDDISSDEEEESDKENTAPLPKPSRKDHFSGTRDPMKEFLDEEAMEDDSDNELLHLEDEDEENDVDMEEHCDYIVTNYKEKTSDREKRKQLDRTLCQQQDEAELENLNKKFNPGAKQQEPTLLEEDDEDKDDTPPEDAEDESDSEDGSDSEDAGILNTRVTTKMLKQSIPLMFTDADDGFVSSEDEEIERKSLSKQQTLRKEELERKRNLASTAEGDSSKQVLSRIKKLNSGSDTKKKAKTPSFFDALLTKGSSSNSNKSLFLRRASSNPAPSSNPVPSSHKQGSSTGRSYIFGRDDSRSSSSITDDLAALNQTETQVKKVVSAKFSASQVKRCTQETQTRSENVTGSSLFEILKQSCVQTSHDAQENVVDQQAIFASFKSVKKQIKVSGRL